MQGGFTLEVFASQAPPHTKEEQLFPVTCLAAQPATLGKRKSALQSQEYILALVYSHGVCQCSVQLTVCPSKTETRYKMKVKEAPVIFTLL